MGTRWLPPWATFVVGAIVALIAVSAVLAYTQTATIKVAAPPQRLESRVALNQGEGSLSVQPIDVTVTETAQGTATGSAPTAATYAAGQVRFLLVCGASVFTPPCQPFTVPTGTIVVSVRGRRYATTSPAALHPPPGSQTATVGVRAVTVGAAGNTGAGTIMAIENNPRPPPSSPGVLTVFNYYAIDGGADAGVAQVIQQSDVDAAQTALAAKVSDDLASEILAEAKGMAYLVDGPPALDITFDHTVGDQAPGFTATMTGKLGARAFSNDAAQAILRTALLPMVLPGYTLSIRPIQANYHLIHTDDSSGAMIVADAVGYAVPSPSRSTVRTRLRGLSLSEALKRLRHDFPGSSIDIRTKPLALPWLPLVSDHINLTVIVEPGA